MLSIKFNKRVVGLLLIFYYLFLMFFVYYQYITLILSFFGSSITDSLALFLIFLFGFVATLFFAIDVNPTTAFERCTASPNSSYKVINVWNDNFSTSLSLIAKYFIL